MEHTLDDPDFHYENIREKDWKVFIGKNADYYVEKWIDIERGVSN